MTSGTPVLVRPALPEEYAAVGELTAAAYVADGLAGPAYAELLRDAAGRAADGELLVATGSGKGTAHRAVLLGTVALFPAGAEHAQLAGPGEMEIRMLAVDPAARGQGAGAALAAACVQRALGTGASGIRLSTDRRMTTAHRIYGRLGFRRTPDRDWSPVPGSTLITYALDLTEGAAYCDRCGAPLDRGTHVECARGRRLEPPRYCRRCRRRLVVQVTPSGWTARCAEHGELSGDEAHLA